jgi:hypothetical protein
MSLPESRDIGGIALLVFMTREMLLMFPMHNHCEIYMAYSNLC